VGDIFDVYQVRGHACGMSSGAQRQMPGGEGARFLHDDAQGIAPIVIVGTDGGFDRGGNPGKPDGATSSPLRREASSFAYFLTPGHGGEVSTATLRASPPGPLTARRLGATEPLPKLWPVLR
jgi:hypothetical protein